MISVASLNQHQILCASRDKIYYLLINENKIEFIKTVKLDYEIACLDINPFKENEMANICAVGLWKDISARILKLPDLTQLCVESLGGDVIPRSIIIEILENIPYLFVSLGDGSVVSYIIGKHDEFEYELTERRKVVLGTQPTILKKFKSFKNEITNNIFACSDRPSVISTNNQKLVYSSVNLKQVEYMCPINSKSYPDSLALLSDGILRIGTMDNIQKLHIRTVKLNETVRRIAYQTDTQTFGIITLRYDIVGYNGELSSIKASASTLCPNQHNCTTKLSSEVSTSAGGGNTATSSKLASNVGASNVVVDSTSVNKLSASQQEECMVSSFLILDQNTFEVLHSVKFQMYELATSIISITFEGETLPFYVIGCCQVIEDEPEPKIGRIVVFKFYENKLIQICEKEIKGSPFTMSAFNGKLLTSVNNSIKLWEYSDEQLNLLTSFSDNVFITHLTCKNDFILVGDVMRSSSVLIYRNDNNCFELVAKDNTPIWLNSMEMIDDENFIISDSFFNLTLLKKDRFCYDRI
jgi:DNA damage-binding protein 1